SYDIPSLKGDIHGNFIGIKIGDLTDNAKTRGFDKIETRSNVTMDLSCENRPIHKNEISEITFSSKNLSDLQGFQLTLDINPNLAEIIELIGNKVQRFGEDNFSLFHLSEGKVSISWNNELAKSDESLFTLKIRSKVDGKISDVLQINSSITEALSVDKNGEEGRIQLRTFNGFKNEFIVMQNEPNPWKQTTTIGMLLPHKGDVTMTIYDVTGRVFYKQIKILDKGYNEWDINKSEIAGSGVYYYQLDYETSTKTNKMIVVE
ncbi:MAG: T9SS type A sorting domain-containing protein, partial [Saprospiraceae bacterium]